MWIFIKCVWWNKFSLVGFLLIIVAITKHISEGLPPNISWFTLSCLIIGQGCLILTIAGYETYAAYRRAEVLILGGQIEVVRMVSTHAAYCVQVGFQAALRENEEGAG